MRENELRQDKNMEYHTSIGVVACVKNCHVSSIVAVVAFRLLGHDSILLARRAIIGSLENYLSSFSCGHSARVKIRTVGKGKPGWRGEITSSLCHTFTLVNNPQSSSASHGKRFARCVQQCVGFLFACVCPSGDAVHLEEILRL